MKLYTSPTTPFGRKILVLLREADLLDKVAIELVSGTPLEAGSLPYRTTLWAKSPCWCWMMARRFMTAA